MKFSDLDANSTDNLIERAVAEFADSVKIQPGDIANHGMVGNVKVLRITGDVAEVIDRSGKHIKLQLSSLHMGPMDESVVENYEKHSAAAAKHDKFIEDGDTDDDTYKQAIKHHERAAKTAPDEALRKVHTRKAEQYFTKSKSTNEAAVTELSSEVTQRYVAGANKSRDVETEKMTKTGKYDPKIADKMGRRAEFTMKAKQKMSATKKEGFPYDVDHMPGAVIRNAPLITDNVAYKFKADWDRAVNQFNSSLFDDECEFISSGERKRVVAPNGDTFAIWDEVGNKGWINNRGHRVRPWGKDAVANEGVVDTLKKASKALTKPAISDKEVADYATATQVIKRTKTDPAYKKRFAADPKGATADVWKEAVDVAALHVGDPVKIVGNVEGAGERGTFIDAGISGAFVVVKMEDGSKRSYHSSNVEYDEEDYDEFEESVQELAMPYSEFKNQKMWTSVARKAGHSIETASNGAKLVAYNKRGEKVGTYDTDADRGHIAGSSVNEVHKIGDNVTITKGPKDVVGKQGRIGEIRRGAFKGADKTYTVDHEGGSIQLSKKQFTGQKGKKPTVTESILDQALQEGVESEYTANHTLAASAQGQNRVRYGKYCLTKADRPVRGQGFLCFNDENSAIYAWKKLSNNAGVKIVRESAFAEDGTPLKEGEVLLIDPHTLTESRYDGQGYARERWDTNTQGYQDREQGRMDQQGRDFRRSEMDQELAHERNNYAVNIDGRQWKVFGDQRRANNVAHSIMQKYPNKKATVHPTGAPVNEATQEERKTTRTRALIADYEKRAKETKNDIKKKHLMDMAKQLRDELTVSEAATPKKQATAPRNFVAKNAKMGGAGAHKDQKRAVKQGEQKHKGKLEEAEDGYAKVEKAIAQHKRTLKNKLATPTNVAYAQKMIARGNAALKKETGDAAYKHFQGGKLDEQSLIEADLAANK